MIRAMCLGVLIVVSAAPQRPARSQQQWETRLVALRPSTPLEYFELGEEVADAATGDADLELASHLFGLAGALDPGRLGRSACLALADLARDDHIHRRYLALATLLDRRGGAGGWSGLEEVEVERGAGLAVAEALSHYRRGDGDGALKKLRQPGAIELLRAHGTALTGGVERFLADCEFFRNQSRPFVSDHDLIAMLRLEVALLAGVERSWADELLLTGGRPLVEVDPGRPQETFGVDASRPYFRGGEWRASSS